MKLFAAYTSGGPNNYENFIGKPRRAGGAAFLEIGNANGSKGLPINLGTTTNNIAECALVFSNAHFVRGLHGLGWIGLRRFFDPTHYGGLKKIQPSPTYYVSPIQLTWVGLNSWVGQIFFITIIIKLSRKKYITPAT